MKKRLFTIILSFTLVSMPISPVFGAESAVGIADNATNLKVEKNGVQTTDKTVTDSGKFGNISWSFNSTTGNLVINGKGVVSTDYEGAPWHKYKERIRHLTVEKGITKLEGYVVYNYSNIETITLPEGLKSIEGEAIRGCVKVKQLTLPASFEEFIRSPIDGWENLCDIQVDSQNRNFKAVNGVLYNKAMDQLIFYPKAKEDKSFSIPKGIKSIADDSLSWTTYLKEVKFPEGFKRIEESSLYGSQALEEIDLPSSLEYIGGDAFTKCRKLKSIVIPAKVKTIGLNAFSVCNSLESIRFENDTCYIGESRSTIPDSTIIYGQSTSTAAKYAKRYGKKFHDVSNDEVSNFYGGNQCYIDLLPTKGITASEPVDHNSYYTDSETGHFLGYWTEAYHETDLNNPDYVELKSFTENLVKECKNDYEKAKTISEWVSSNLDYAYGSSGGNRIDAVYYIFQDRY